MLVARREDRLKTLAADLRARYGVAVDILVADLTDEAGIRAVEEALRSNTAIDTLINNAGTAQMAPFLAGDVAQHQAINTLNTTALMRLTYAILPRLAQNNRGTLINIASVLALHVRAGSALYSATKAWVLSFTRGLQEEFADSSVRIQAVLPAATATEIWSHSGVTVNDLPEGSVMTTDDMVDASLAGLDQGEPITIRRCMTPACGIATKRRVLSCSTARAPAFRHRATQNSSLTLKLVAVLAHPGGQRGECVLQG